MAQSGIDLVTSLRRRGVKVWADNGAVRFQAPKGILLPEELAQLRLMKGEIVRVLEQAQCLMDDPVKPREVGCSIPVTPMQLRVWGEIVERGITSSTRWCTFATRAFGALNIALLQKSIETVVWRHESLRTRIVADNGTPRQLVDMPCEYNLSVIVLSRTSSADNEREVKRLAQEFADEKVDISVGPLFEARLFELSARDHVLILAFDFIISDAISIQLVNSELWTSYEQTVRGRSVSLPQVTLQFADYAIWLQRTYDAWADKHESYWRDRLTGAPCVRLPFDYSATQMRPAEGAMRQIALNDTLSASLRAMARRERTTLPLVMLSVYIAVMAGWCNRRDLVIAFVSNGRYRPELQNIVGLVASRLYLRVGLDHAECFLDLLGQVSREFYSAHDHRDFDRVPLLIPECNTELQFNWLPDGWDRVPVSEREENNDRLLIQRFPFRAMRSETFIPLFFDTPDGINVTVRYRPDLLAHSSIERFGRNLRILSEEITQHPHVPVTSILAMTS